MEELIRWESWAALEECIRRDGTTVARQLHCSPSLVSKWREAPVGKDILNSGARNPLDRLAIIIETIERIHPDRAYVPIKWLCARFSFLPPVKMPNAMQTDDDLLAALLFWNKEMGETSRVISEALKDGRVTQAEFEKVYREAMEDVGAILSLLAKLKERVV
jgi:hypothetical protein